MINLFVGLSLLAYLQVEAPNPKRNLTEYAEIQVLDSENGKPVPLVELETVNGIRFVTDNAGRVAFHEPGLMGTEVYFSVRSHGYNLPKDGFGFSGVKLVPRPGEATTLSIDRKNIAARICRLTGEGRYRDSLLLGYPFAKEKISSQGLVAGQDSVQATVYQNKVVWLWGDTLRMNYPLGQYRTSGAITPIFDSRADHSAGFPFEYFVDPKSGFSRPMMPLAERPDGVVWIFGLFVVPDEKGIERLVAHYSRRGGLERELEHGIAMFDDVKSEFTSIQQLPLNELWRKPNGHPIQFQQDGKTWLLFGSPNPNVRVPATLHDVLTPSSYEAFTCEKVQQGQERILDLGTEGRPKWRWQSDLPPIDSEQEMKWVNQGKLEPQWTRFLPSDASDPSTKITLHRGTVRWNPFRNRWILIAGQINGKSSMLGEVWYAESPEPTGPFSKAVQIVTHDRQTFYNVCHHDFLDQKDGRIVYFEGTYTKDFSGNQDKTPRYNYNQILYQLNLEDPKLLPAMK